MDKNGYVACSQDERVQAGMMAMDEGFGDAPPNWSIYFSVEEVESTVEKVNELGGKVLIPPSPAGEIGEFTVVQDPQGAVFSVIRNEDPASPPPGY